MWTGYPCTYLIYYPHLQQPQLWNSIEKTPRQLHHHHQQQREQHQQLIRRPDERQRSESCCALSGIMDNTEERGGETRNAQRDQSSMPQDEAATAADDDDVASRRQCELRSDEDEATDLLHMISHSLDRFNAIVHPRELSNHTSGLGHSGELSPIDFVTNAPPPQTADSNPEETVSSLFLIYRILL